MLLIQKRLSPGQIIDAVELAEYGRVVDTEDGKKQKKNDKRGANDRIY
jgi:hypothetical protein